MPPADSPGADSAASAGSGSPPANGPAGTSPAGLPGLRDRLRSGAPIAATFVMIPRVEIVEMAVGAGFGAVVCDLEHGLVTTEDLPALHAAARAAGAYSLARIASDRAVEISRALDMGVDGVIVPHVGSRSAAERVVAAGRFAPAGERSLNPYVRGVGYGLDDSDPTGRANKRSALVAMIEGADALGAVGDIAAVTELDALFFGPVDLAGSLGHPGQPEHPEVVAMIGDLVSRLTAAGVATGIYAPTAEAARRWLSLGVRLVVTSADNAMTMSAFAAMRSAIGEAVVPALREPVDHGTQPDLAGRPRRPASLMDGQAGGWVPGRGWGWGWGADDEAGALNAITPQTRLAALALARTGQVVDLGVLVDKGSFLWGGHVATEVVSYRTPDGIRRGGDLAPIGSDPAGLSFRTSMVIISDHAGTQLDSLAHATTGADNHWYNGFTDARHGTDFGPRRAGGETIRPVIARGVLLDVAGWLGVENLAAGQGIGPDDLAAVAAAQGTELRAGDVICIRTGSLRHWGEAGHDREALAGPDTAGITLAAARWLCEEAGPVIIASDTSTVEVMPALDGAAAQPVHEYLLVEQGVLMGELHYLEELAARRAYEFCYIALCPKVRGTTAGFALRPVALL